MQPAVTLSTRGTLAAALLLSAALFVPAEYALSSTVTLAERAPAVDGNALVADDGWQHANYLAWAIRHRRYADIEAAAAQIDASSPYARWVPAAIGLAVEQLDATAGAYAQMGRCRELGAFQRRIAGEWPAGRAAMRARPCGSLVCGTGRAEMIKELGGVAAYRSVQQVLRAERFTERVLEIDRAMATGDHASALASCGEIGGDDPMPAMCLTVACRAGELTIAEVLLPHGDDFARGACADAGITFANGSDIAYGNGTWRTHPADLVHVHPDAPPVLDVIVDW
ncbi:MAG: hypothetical protein M4D80_06530 [Myxococcota bacterium]|nr:hypothetical protein [Myxococcota bacterium]